MNNHETRLWNMFRSGQMPFAEFKEQYEELTGEVMPNGVAELGFPMGPITKRRHDYLQKMGEEVAERVNRRLHTQQAANK